MQAMADQGITSASDAATGRDSLDADLAMYRDALESGRLPGRITLMPQIVHIAPPDTESVLPPDALGVGAEPDWLRIGSTKIFSDGAMSTYTAAVREPYEGTDQRGILIWEPATLDDMVDRAHRAGWQIAIHAIGDRAIETVLDAYQHALESAPRQDHRHRIEHCMMADSDLVERMHDLGVLPSLQPDIFRLGDGYVAALGIDRASQVIPVALFSRLGVPIAFSSDRPVVPGDPLACIRDAMERRTPSGVVLGPEHRVSAEQALWSYTAGGAFVTHTDQRIGTLRRGMLADLAVLSHDPTRTQVESFGQIQVTMTVTGGRIVYAK
jgi:predicted amidohydrolase YtcJ